MAKKPLPCPKRLLQLLHYNQFTGVFTWRPRTEADFPSAKRRPDWVAKIWNSNYAGKVASGQRDHGYHSICVERQSIYAHRVAWAMHYGFWPKGSIDHINGDRSDNRIANLRVVSVRGNNKNSAIQSNNTSGHVGVSLNRETGKWWAYIHNADGKRVLLGAFRDKAKAIDVRKRAEKTYGYHENHGRALVY